MSQESKIKLFQEQSIRSHWDDEQEQWYFSIVDVVAVLTEQQNPQTARKYWNKLKERLKKEGNQTVTNCHQLKMWMILNCRQFVDNGKDMVLNMLAEASTTEISKKQQPQGLEENKQVAKKGGNAAKQARLEIEKQTGEPIVSSDNAKALGNQADD